MMRSPRMESVLAFVVMLVAPVRAFSCLIEARYDLEWPLLNEALPEGNGILLRGSSSPISPVFELLASDGTEVSVSTTVWATGDLSTALYLVQPQLALTPDAVYVLSVVATYTEGQPEEFAFRVTAADAGGADAGDLATAVSWTTYYADGLVPTNSCQLETDRSVASHATGSPAAVPRILVSRNEDFEIGQFVPPGVPVDNFLTRLRVDGPNAPLWLEVVGLDGRLLSTEQRGAPDRCFDADATPASGTHPPETQWSDFPAAVDSISRSCASDSGADAGCGIGRTTTSLTGLVAFAFAWLALASLPKRRRVWLGLRSLSN